MLTYFAKTRCIFGGFLLYINVAISPQLKCIVMSDFKDTCIWMSYRYAIGRKSITSVMHARDIAKHMDWIDPDRWDFTGRDILREVNDRIGWYKNVHINSFGDENYDVFSVIFQWFTDHPVDDVVRYFVEHEWKIDLVYGVVVDIRVRKDPPKPSDWELYPHDDIFRDYSDYKDWIKLANLFRKNTKTVTIKNENGLMEEKECVEWWDCRARLGEVTLNKRYSDPSSVMDGWFYGDEYIIDVK